MNPQRVKKYCTNTISTLSLERFYPLYLMVSLELACLVYFQDWVQVLYTYMVKQKGEIHINLKTLQLITI